MLNTRNSKNVKCGPRFLGQEKSVPAIAGGQTGSKSAQSFSSWGKSFPDSTQSRNRNRDEFVTKTQFFPVFDQLNWTDSFSLLSTNVCYVCSGICHLFLSKNNRKTKIIFWEQALVEC